MLTPTDWLDITRELTAAPVYEGDPAPELYPIARINDGDLCNLTALSLCLHNGTHMDAPHHFINGGNTIEQIPPDVFVGSCRVIEWSGELTGIDIDRLPLQGVRRLLFKGEIDITPNAAFVLSTLAADGLCLIGVEAQSIAPPAYVLEVHRQLLGANIILLEGLDLTAATAGDYTLYAFPLKIAEADGAPVRAFLALGAGLDVEQAFTRS